MYEKIRNLLKMKKLLMIIGIIFCIWLFYIYDSSLRVDTNLKLSHDDFKQSFEEFYVNKQLSPIDQLNATPHYPTPYVLAQFANMAYADYERGDPKPPDGWQLLTTASNFWITNGYFGTAYWHPVHQQVVIAHRGTEFNIWTEIESVCAVVTIFKNFVATFADVHTDFTGIIFNNHVNQVHSASTFANKVVAVLQEIEQEKNVIFELFFTGHSLGGWLAQITTFTTEYLEVKEGIFLKKQKIEEHEPLTSSTVQDSHDITYSYHPHTVVFDSPGCKDMLSQMADTFDVRLRGRSVVLQHLDITSFLSAPNLINTRNKHLGTVYRISTDLSDMGWKEKHTPLYNLATHNMDKIMHVFDPETGQVRKDDKGEPKIYEVVDWPVSAFLTGDTEYNSFFKSAEQPSNYHPQEMGTVPNKLPQDDPVHYQTIPYDERNVSLSVFTQDEREFLEHYHSLRHVPDFFKPREIFSVLNNAEAENEAEQKLENFEIWNGRICFPDNSTLHATIPYVRRLVRLFPHIKEKAKDQLSIRHRFYQHETQLYVENIRQSALDFNPGVLGLGAFLTSDQQIWQLRMVDGDAWAGITKVYRILQNTSSTHNYSSEGNYTILKLKWLLTDNRKMNLSALLASMEKPHLLMIACGTNQTVNDELRDLFMELFSILKQKKTMKIILTTQLESDTTAFIQQIATETLDEGFILTDEQLTWSDLTASSQRKLLEKTVIFQGTRVALNQLISAESIADSFPLADLLQEKELRIGEETVLSVSSGYNEKYYINRTFNHTIFIRQDITFDKREGKFADLMASTEQEFKQLCQQNPTNNVHWLQKDKSGELIWQQSQGNLQALRKYIDTHKNYSYAPSDLDKLLQQAKNHRIMIIADKAGMGKTTVLTHLSKQIKQKFPAHWFVRINLNDYTELLEAQKGKKLDKERVLEFLSKEVLKLESYLEKELFKKSLEGNESSKVVVMADGFDEISPEYKETVIDMLHVLKHTSLEQLWVTTRPHLREDLEDNLQQFSYTLKPFSEDEQVAFLKKFWSENLNCGVTNQHKLQTYSTSLIRKFAQSISDKDREFTGIPLQTLMLAEAFKEDFFSFFLSEKTEPELPHKLDLLGLYRKFIESKYDVYYREKSKIPAGNLGAKEQRKRDLKNIKLEHQRLALQALFTEDEVTFLQNDSDSTLSREGLARIGIAQRNNEGKPQFIHRTFAEYFVAKFLIKQLKSKTEESTKVQDFLLNKVLLRTDVEVTRSFLNALLENFRPSNEVFKDYGKKLDEMWNEREIRRPLPGVTTALHTAAAENNVRIIRFLLDSLKSGENSNSTKKMLLATDDKGQTALHMAADTNSVQALEGMWEWVEIAHLNSKEIKNKFLLAKDKNGVMAWHRATALGSLEALETLWSWATKAELNRDELLLAQTQRGLTALHIAGMVNNLRILEKLWVWAEEAEVNAKELKKNLLLAKDNEGYTAWHRAVFQGNLEAFETLWNWVEEVKLNQLEFLLAQNENGSTALQLAACGNHVGILENLWFWAEKAGVNANELKKKLLLAKDNQGYTAWHRAAQDGSLKALETLCSWAKETELKQVEFLLAPNEKGATAFHLAAYGNHVGILEKLWVWAKEAEVNANEIKKKLLLAKDNEGFTAWHRAAQGGSLEALETLWSWAKEAELNQLEFLLAQNEEGETAFHIAVRVNNSEILKKLWVWAGEAEVNANEIKKKLFLTKNNQGYTAWHRAAQGGSLEALETLWNLVKEAELNQLELLLAQNENGSTALHIAATVNNLEILKKLWVWAEEVEVNANELKKKLLLAKDNEGYTVWHRAAREGSLEAFETLCSWAKEAELNQLELLLAQNKINATALHTAAYGNHVGILEKLWVWAEEVEINANELKKKLLLAKDDRGYTAWHLAAHGGSLEALEILWSWAKEVLLKPDELLLSRSEYGITALHLAAHRNDIKILQKLWVWAEEAEVNANKLKKKLLLAKDIHGFRAWHEAAKEGSLEALETLWSWAKEVVLKPDELLLSRCEYGLTALHLAASGNHVKILEKLWVWAEEVEVNANELKKKLLLAKDQFRFTAWHHAVLNDSLEALEILRTWAKEVELNTDE